MKLKFQALALLVAAAGATTHAAGRPPNFILILADDLGYGDIAPFGSQVNRTPNLDRMAREGLKLTSFYAAPVCTPSRAQVITGCYAKRVGLPHVIFPRSEIGLNPAEHTIAELLKACGYATGCIGKWHLGDHPDFLPTRHGFDEYFGIPYSNDMGRPREPKPDDQRPPLPLVRNDTVIETLAPPDQDRLTERYTDEAVRFIRAHRDRPFFLYLPHTAVHTPIHPGEKFHGTTYSPFGDWVAELDWSVGRVLDTVNELKLEKDTLVIFTSDNGPWLVQGTNGGVAGPLRGGKGSTFEGGVREPTLAWWPGHIRAGSSCDAVAANFDFLPTFVKLAGGTLPNDRRIDGRDISPLLLGRSRKSPHEAFYYFQANKLQAVRSGPWKLVIVPRAGEKPDAGSTFQPLLYNLNAEIGERTDVAAEHPEVVRRMQKLIANMETDLGAVELGPNVRSAARVPHPVGLWLPGQSPKAGSQ
jgi:arylsulfatase A-like enzyme